MYWVNGKPDRFQSETPPSLLSLSSEGFILFHFFFLVLNCEVPSQDPSQLIIIEVSSVP